MVHVSRLKDLSDRGNMDCENTYLSPDGSETACGIIVNASCIRAELERFAELDQKVWDALRRILSDRFPNTQRSLTFGAIASRGVTFDYTSNIRESCLQQGCCGRVGNIGQRLREVDWVIVGFWNGLRICEIQGESDIEDGVVERWLWLLGLHGRFPKRGECRGWKASSDGIRWYSRNCSASLLAHRQCW